MVQRKANNLNGSLRLLISDQFHALSLLRSALGLIHGVASYKQGGRSNRS